MTDILVADFVKGLLIFLRISGVMFSAPVFSNSSIPSSVKLFFSIILAYLLFFTVDGFQFDVNQNIIHLILLGLKEVITGILMGFMLNFIFYGFSYAGLLIGYDMGLAMAQMFDPTTESDTNIMGQSMLILATLVFLVINGHHYLIRGLSYSFNVVPLGTFEMSQGLMDAIIKFSAGIFVLAVKIASPIMVSFFLLHLGSGIIARVMPQMNIFFVVQPVKISLGLTLLITLTPVYVYLIRNLLMAYEDKLFELIKAING